MTADDDIEILPPEEAEIAEPTPKKRFGPAALTGTAFLASLLGAGTMFGASTLLPETAPDIGPTEAKVKSLTDETQSLKAEAKTLKAQINRLQRDMATKPSATPDLSPLEARLAALENVETPPAQINEDMLVRLEALQEGESGALDLSDILDRLSALEERSAVPPESDNSDILARLEALETRSVTVESMPVITATSQPNLTPAFPEDAIRAAIDDVQGSEGWLKRSLKKHISVQSEDNPAFLLETILEALEASDIETALTAFDKLPPRVKSAGTDWRERMERSE